MMALQPRRRWAGAACGLRANLWRLSFGQVPDLWQHAIERKLCGGDNNGACGGASRFRRLGPRFGGAGTRLTAREPVVQIFWIVMVSGSWMGVADGVLCCFNLLYFCLCLVIAILRACVWIAEISVEGCSLSWEILLVMVICLCG